MEVLSVSEWAKTWKADTLISISKVKVTKNAIFLFLPILNKLSQFIRTRCVKKIIIEICATTPRTMNLHGLGLVLLTTNINVCMKVVSASNSQNGTTKPLRLPQLYMRPPKFRSNSISPRQLNQNQNWQ
jgi:hypothetical protein